VLKITTAKEMQEIDRVTIERSGIAGIVLMERAGLSVVSRVNQLYPARKVKVLCGGGNNGGDGFVIARELHNQGKDVAVYAVGAEKLKGDARTNYDAAKKYGVKIHSIHKFLTLNSKFSTRNSLIVDALLGTGLQNEIRRPLSNVIDKVNNLRCPVIAVDIPSGISSDSGQVMGCAVKADHTVTFGLPKRGHFLFPGADFTGQLFVEDIGFPGRLLVSDKISVSLVQKTDAAELVPQRARYSHKGSYGHVLFVAGSKGKTGAALMAAKACLKTGAGLVTIGVPESLVNAFQSRVTEEMILPLADDGNGAISYKAADAVLSFLGKRGSVLAVGPGLSVHGEISKLVRRLVAESGVPMVVDADGLNALAGKTGILKKRRAPVILTPHTGEMARLLQGSGTRGQGSGETAGTHLREEIEQDRINVAVAFAKKTKSYLVLKGAPTVTASPDGNAYINTSGNPGMATAGTGDVLTGMIAAFLAQKVDPLEASVLGVYMHGLTGDAVAEKRGQHSLVASDIIKAIPSVFKSLKQ
jgi:NAD(P)H-hydrate epimerase